MLNPEQRKILLALSPRNLYLVGGSVRDTLMDRAGNDLDITVVGDAIHLARQFALATGGECTTHERFGTATVVTEGVSIDLITARSESYPAPGALPDIRPGTLEEDLARRDFSINAMAVSIADGTLIDNHNGRPDIEDRLVRTLHPYSFYDDPTRMLRAVRYEQRLQFKLAEHTERQLTCAVRTHALDQVSGDRIRHEIERTTLEPSPLPIFQRMNDLRIFQAVHPGWAPDFSQIPDDWNPNPAAWLMVATWTCEPETLEAVIKRLNMPREWAHAVHSGRAIHQALPNLTKATTPESVCQALDPVQPALRTLDVAKLVPAAAETLSRYTLEWSQVRPKLNGQEIMEMGVPAGPEIGALIQELRILRLNNPKATKENEESTVRNFLATRHQNPTQPRSTPQPQTSKYS